MMARVVFTRNLERHVACPPAEAPGGTVRAVLDAVFADNPRLRGYILDDQGHLRQHVVVFVDGYQVRDRDGLADPVAAGSQIAVMQALSGG
jgi:sulfur-carrier protein